MKKIIGLLALSAAAIATAPAAHADGAPTLTVARSAATLTYGDAEQLTGRLTGPDGVPLTSATVGFYGRTHGNTTWAHLTDGVTEADGTVRFTHQPGGHVDYQLRYDAVTSPTAFVQVKPRLTAGITVTKALVGTVSTIKGSIAPAPSGQGLWLEQWIGSGWKGVQKKAVTAGYGFNVKPTTTTTGIYRINRPADLTHLAAVSPAFTFTTYRAAISGINAGDEYATVTNTGTTAINLQGWQLDGGDQGQRYTLPSYGLAAHASVRVWTGSAGSGIRLGRGTPMWNNDGDTGTLIDPRGVVASRFVY